MDIEVGINVSIETIIITIINIGLWCLGLYGIYLLIKYLRSHNRNSKK